MRSMLRPRRFRTVLAAALLVASFTGSASADTRIGVTVAPPVPVYNPPPAYIPTPVPAYPPPVALPPPVAPLPPQVTYFTPPVVVPLVVPDQHIHNRH